MNPNVYFSMIMICYPVFWGKSIIFPHIYKDLHTVPLISRALSVPVENTGGRTACHSHTSSHTTRDYPVRESTISTVFSYWEISLQKSLLPRIRFSIFPATNFASRGHQLEMYVPLWTARPLQRTGGWRVGATGSGGGSFMLFFFFLLNTF